MIRRVAFMAVALLLVTGAAGAQEPAKPTTTELRQEKQLLDLQAQNINLQMENARKLLQLAPLYEAELNKAAQALEQKAVAALGGAPGDKVDWSTLTLIKAEKVPGEEWHPAGSAK